MIGIGHLVYELEFNRMMRLEILGETKSRGRRLSFSFLIRGSDGIYIIKKENPESRILFFDWQECIAEISVSLLIFF